MASKQRWHERLFGKTLIKCDSVRDNEYELTDCVNCFKNCDVTAIYFSFANINAQSDDVTKQLVSLYHRINNAGQSNDVKNIEVVQIVMWANNDVFGDFEQSHRDSIVDLPWYAVPFTQIELKSRLSRRYRIKAGVPTIVLVDKEGRVITCSGKERLLEDPAGDAFPWRPRPIHQVLKDVTLVCGRLYGEEHPVGPADNAFNYHDLPTDAIRGFYFSAHWCPPCRAFTPQLVDTYRLLRTKDPNFEIIFVSSDRSAESYESYMEMMPWLAVPWEVPAVRAELAQLYGVRGIPTLLLVEGNGQVINYDARADLIEDPRAQNFPWKPRPVNILTERYATKLHDYPAVVLFIEDDEAEIQFAESVLTPAADIYHKKYNISFNEEEFLWACEDEHYIQFLIGLDSDTSDVIRDLIGLDDVVPLLVGVDIPNNRFAVMNYGQEITVHSVSHFVEKFQNGEMEFRQISDRIPDAIEKKN